MHNLKKMLILSCLGAFWWYGILDLLHESKSTVDLFRNLYPLSDNQKRAALLPKTWPIAEKISRIIPENARVLLHTENFNEVLYLAYALYPRKFFMKETAEMHYLPAADNLGLDWQWLEQKKISWVVVRTSDGLIRVMEIAGGAILQESHFPG